MNGEAEATRVKICGLTCRDDAACAAEFGADFLGLVLAPSPRRVVPSAVAGWVGELKDRFPAVRWVGVFARPSPEEVQAAVAALGLDLVQLHGYTRDDPPDPALASGRGVILATTPADLPRDEPASTGVWAHLVDSAPGGGTGRTFDWGLIEGPRRHRLFLAGGLDAGNVRQAIAAVRPYAVDASSRLESAPGRKDQGALRAFVKAVKGA